MEGKEDTPAVKRTSSEQRKLRCRDAARCRRSQETEVFYDLARTLPLPRRVSAHLDKSAIIRVALSFLRMNSLLRPACENQREEEEEEDPMDCCYPQALAGFITVMTEEGDVIYLTENVSRHIGITQLELLGRSIYDFVHPCDQEELRDLMTPRPGLSKKASAVQRSERNFFLRMKSTLTSRGRSVNIKSAAWKVLHCTGHIRQVGGGSTSTPVGGVMTLLCEPVPHPSSVEFPLDMCTFLTRHTMDLRFTHCEGRVTELVGYKPEDLIGRSAYEFHHALDSDHVNKSLHTLLSKGQVNTRHYRFLANSGGFVWVETQATVLYSSQTSQPDAVVCLNFILSGVEQPDSVFSVEQIRCCRLPEDEAQSSEGIREDCGTSDISDCDSEHQTEDEFFTLKETLEELLHLAPDAGDAIVPLTDDSVELSFASSPGPNSVPVHPQDLCTPQLRQLLSPIFSSITTPSSSSSTDLQPSPCEEDEEEEEEEDEEEEEMDTSQVKFLSVSPEDGPEKGETLEVMDLDMLAPYISMDDDFQLTVLSSSTEEDDKPSSPSSELAVSRKRTHNPDEETSSQLVIQDKRQKPDSSSREEELLVAVWRTPTNQIRCWSRVLEDDISC